jgi:putative transposase
MRTSKFTVEQISSTLRRAESGIAVAESCRELGITERTFYRWKRKYGGIGTPELRELLAVARREPAAQALGRDALALALAAAKDSPTPG